MEQRLNIEKELPEAFKAMYGLVASLSKISLSPIQKELIKLRASQINGCAFCLNMHTRDALRMGETPQRIALLNAWRETSIYTAEEKAILALTEEVTLIHRGGVSEETYKNAQQYFSAVQIAEIVMCIVLINAWNRIAVTSHTPLD